MNWKSSRSFFIQTQALFTGDVEVPANPHELVIEETASGKLSSNERRTPRTKGLSFFLSTYLLVNGKTFSEVKIMSIPKIAISNEDDSSLQILETCHVPMNTIVIPSSPVKSIIKNRSSLPPTPSSTTTTAHSYHTCPTRADANESTVASSVRKKSTDQSQIRQPRMIDENDTENDVSELSHVDELAGADCPTAEAKIHRRRETISTTSVLPSNDPLNELVQPKRSRLRKNRSFTAGNSDRSTVIASQNSSRNCFIPHVSTPPPPLPYAEKNARDSLTQIPRAARQRRLNPVRRTHSYRPSSSASSTTTLRRFVVRDGKLIEQAVNATHPILKRRSTLDNSSYPMTQIENSSVYGTPRNDESEQYHETNVSQPIRLVTDDNASAQVIVNDQSDMQLDLTTNVRKRTPQEVGVSHSFAPSVMLIEIRHYLPSFWESMWPAARQ